MATLGSPGVQVQVIDESFYTSGAGGTVPMIFVSSAQDKTNPSGSTALGTTAENAGKVWLVTSQRDLTDTFGTPLFYTDASGNPQHGNELNEYGLQAAYSLLGASSLAYIVRADVDLSALTPTSSTPLGTPVAGTYWLDTDATSWGIKEWNSVTGKFSAVTPIVLDDNSPDESFDGSAPASSIGFDGDYCIVATSANTITLYRKNISWVLVSATFDGGKEYVTAPHYSYPAFTGSTQTGSTWINTTTPSNGANWVLKYFNSATQDWTTVSAPIYATVNDANKKLSTTGQGSSIPTGTIYINSDENNQGPATFAIWRKNNTGSTDIVSATTNALSTEGLYEFTIRESNTAGSWGASTLISISPASNTTLLGSLIPAALAAAGLTNVTASFNATTRKLTIKHVTGGAFELTDGINSPLNIMGFAAYDVGTQSGTVNLYAAPLGDNVGWLATSWKPLTFEARATVPFTTPADGTLWYTPVVDEVDILIHDGTTWVGYQTAFPNANPAGPIVSATAPTEQSDNTPLVSGDIWVSTADMEMYGKALYVYDGSVWVSQDTTDQSTPDGWLFADARWATSGEASSPSDITDLLASDYLDPDAPDPAMYPRGMRLWNTRRSGNNVKKYVTGYIDLNANEGQNIRYNDEAIDNYFTDRWVSQYSTNEDGSGSFGRHSQRSQVVNSFKQLIDANTTIRDNDTLNFTLLATPGYPEAIQNMIGLNNDRGITAFVVGDTPFRLQPTGTALSEWGKNVNNAYDNGDVGGTSYDEYMAMYYPSGYTNDNTGNYIVVPPSHMMLRTIANSDAKSYPWFAPAGTRRGGVDNATSVGYITAEGEFKTVALSTSIRDVLHSAKVNPIATLTGVGVVAYGQLTRARNASALDRINVSRLVCYLRKQLDVMARPFLFEPNDAQTRREIKAAAESLLLELVGQRALYDFVVVCDQSNNTSARIDRNEMYVDIAIEPVKAVEFIYIPLRLKNTGDIAAGL